MAIKRGEGKVDYPSLKYVKGYYLPASGTWYRNQAVAGTGTINYGMESVETPSDGAQGIGILIDPPQASSYNPAINAFPRGADIAMEGRVMILNSSGSAITPGAELTNVNEGFRTRTDDSEFKYLISEERIAAYEEGWARISLGG